MLKDYQMLFGDFPESFICFIAFMGVYDKPIGNLRTYVKQLRNLASLKTAEGYSTIMFLIPSVTLLFTTNINGLIMKDSLVMHLNIFGDVFCT